MNDVEIDETFDSMPEFYLTNGSILFILDVDLPDAFTKAKSISDGCKRLLKFILDLFIFSSWINEI